MLLTLGEGFKILTLKKPALYLSLAVMDTLHP